MRPSVSVIIPTQRRPEGLKTAAHSVLRQAGALAATIEMIIVDNDQSPSAQAAVAILKTEASFPVHYVHEPTPGVASARNAAAAVASGDFIAFLDDDEEASEAWLQRLLEVQAAFDADVVFGPVRGRAPPSVRRHRAYLEHFFSRTGPSRDGLIKRYFGCGNSLIRRAALPDPALPFDPAHDRTGGEDDYLFLQMTKQSARFAWSVEAFVWEDPSPSRLTLAYTLRRGFAYGQGGTARRALGGGPLSVVWAMTTGAGQAVVFGAMAAALWTLRRDERAFPLERAAKGLGKVLWFRPFHLHFYGLRSSSPIGPQAGAATR